MSGQFIYLLCHSSASGRHLMPIQPQSYSAKLRERKRNWINKQSQREKSRRGDTVIQNSRRWRRVRQIKLNINPLCERCGAPATQVHHKIDRADAPELTFDIENLESLCDSCHSKETASRRGNQTEDKT